MVDKKITKNNNNSLDLTKLGISGILTPDQLGDLETHSSVRFSRENLIASLKTFISSTQQLPIEKFEIDLFEVTRSFHEKLLGKEIDIKCVERIHHVLKLTNFGFSLDGPYEKQVFEKIETIIRNHPMVTLQYHVFKKVLDIWDGLLVKWGIVAFKNYDYRYSGRALNVKLLDLNEINASFFCLDVFWMSSKIASPPLRLICSPLLIELSTLLHEQLKTCFEVFLMLNPKQIDPTYNIESTLAFASKAYSTYYTEALPQENLSAFKHAELKVVKGLAKCFKSSNPRIDYAYKTLHELEMSYRAFEKALIASILKSTGIAEF